MTAIFKILILPILEHGRCFHILMYSSIFLSVLEFLLERSFINLVKSILSYLIWIEVVLNGIIILISFTAGILLDYREVAKFLMLLLHTQRACTGVKRNDQM